MTLSFSVSLLGLLPDLPLRLWLLLNILHFLLSDPTIGLLLYILLGPSFTRLDRVLDLEAE